MSVGRTAQRGGRGAPARGRPSPTKDCCPYSSCTISGSCASGTQAQAIMAWPCYRTARSRYVTPPVRTHAVLPINERTQRSWNSPSGRLCVSVAPAPKNGFVPPSTSRGGIDFCPFPPSTVARQPMRCPPSLDATCAAATPRRCLRSASLDATRHVRCCDCAVSLRWRWRPLRKCMKWGL